MHPEYHTSDGRGCWKVRRTCLIAVEPLVDVAVLHAKIGEVTLTNDFLSGGFGKAGLLPSAKR